jgi:hypothetical protein
MVHVQYTGRVFLLGLKQSQRPGSESDDCRSSRSEEGHVCYPALVADGLVVLRKQGPGNPQNWPGRAVANTSNDSISNLFSRVGGFSDETR